MNDVKCPNCLVQNTQPSQPSMFNYICCMCGASWELENGEVINFSVSDHQIDRNQKYVGIDMRNPIKRIRVMEKTPRSITGNMQVINAIKRDIAAATDLEELASLGKELQRATNRFLSPRVLASLLARRQGGKCNGCRTKPPKQNMQVDHIIPRAKGGETRLDNLQMLCNRCNKRKGVGSMDELTNKIAAMCSQVDFTC